MTVCTHHDDTLGRCPRVDDVRLYVVGPRCPAHTPAALAGRTVPVTTPRAKLRPREAREYGVTRTDPLGRDGPGWHVGTQSKLPTRDKVAKE